jgi:hypothetical protein
MSDRAEVSLLAVLQELGGQSGYEAVCREWQRRLGITGVSGSRVLFYAIVGAMARRGAMRTESVAGTTVWLRLVN